MTFEEMPRGRWLLVSVLAHLVLLAIVSFYVAERQSGDEEPLPIPIELLDLPEEVPADPPPPPPPSAPRLEFRDVRPQRVRERIEIPREELAMTPPLPDAVLELEGSAGGLAIDPVGAPNALATLTLGGEGGGTAGFGIGRGNALGRSGTFQEYVAGLREVGLEVVFVIDATGSMGWVLSEVRERLEDLAASIRRLVPVTRFGIVTYRDRDSPGFVSRGEPLTLSTRKLRDFLVGIEAEGGGDIPEAVEAGIRMAIDEAGWKGGDAQRVIIVVGDAPPHAEEMETALALAQQFRAKGGRLTAVDVGFDANPRVAAAQLGRPVEQLTTLRPRGVLPEFAAIARAGGGDATTLEGDHRVIRTLAKLIFGRQWASDVEPLFDDL